LPLGAFA